MIKALDAQPESGIRIVGLFDDRDEARSPDVVAGYPKIGSVDDLVEYARRTKLDLVIFTLPISAERRILQMLAKLWVLPIDIRLSAHSSKLRLRPRSYSYIGSVPVLDVFDKPIADWDLVLKGLFDRIVGALAAARPVADPARHGDRGEARLRAVRCSSARSATASTTSSSRCSSSARCMSTSATPPHRSS